MLVKTELVLTKRTANSADKQDVDKVLVFIFEKARRNVFQSKKILTAAVYTFILKILAMLCGMSERTFFILYTFYFSKITNFYKHYAVEHWVYTNTSGLAALRPTPPPLQQCSTVPTGELFSKE